jgi:hypothetical protein
MSMTASARLRELRLRQVLQGSVMSVESFLRQERAMKRRKPGPRHRRRVVRRKRIVNVKNRSQKQFEKMKQFGKVNKILNQQVRDVQATLRSVRKNRALLERLAR